MLKLALSPCPNDTFAFHRLIQEGGFDTVFEDIEELNRRAERGGADLVKISVAAYTSVKDRYALLRAGGAAGYGVGPIVVARTARPLGRRIAIPGERTTAALLLRMMGEFDTVAMRFDRIEEAVRAGVVDCGVLIHEGRFTYEKRGLVLLADLGEVWEQRMKCPLPLGAIAIRRELGAEAARALDERIRASVAHARAHPGESADFVRSHAEEMDPEVIRRHIDLYVNDYTLNLDERAVRRLLDQALPGPGSAPVFAY